MRLGVCKGIHKILWWKHDHWCLWPNCSWSRRWVWDYFLRRGPPFMSWYGKDIEVSLRYFLVNYCRRCDKLADRVNCNWNIQASNSEVDKTFNQLVIASWFREEGAICNVQLSIYFHWCFYRFGVMSAEREKMLRIYFCWVRNHPFGE